MNRERLTRLLRFVPALLVVCLGLAPSLILGGCGGNKEPKYTTSFERQMLVEFKPEVTEAEREAIYDKYNLRLLGPFGDRPYSYLLLLRDDMDPVQVREQLRQESKVVGAANNPVGPH